MNDHARDRWAKRTTRKLRVIPNLGPSRASEISDASALFGEKSRTKVKL
jgi:hypothetical protein